MILELATCIVAHVGGGEGNVELRVLRGAISIMKCEKFAKVRYEISERSIFLRFRLNSSIE